MVAMETHYRKSCLASLYNRVRLEEAKKTPKDQEDDIVYGVALAEIIEYIKECAFALVMSLCLN